MKSRKKKGGEGQDLFRLEYLKKDQGRLIPSIEENNFKKGGRKEEADTFFFKKGGGEKGGYREGEGKKFYKYIVKILPKGKKG